MIVQAHFRRFEVIDGLVHFGEDQWRDIPASSKREALAIFALLQPDESNAGVAVTHSFENVCRAALHATAPLLGTPHRYVHSRPWQKINAPADLFPRLIDPPLVEVAGRYYVWDPFRRALRPCEVCSDCGGTREVPDSDGTMICCSLCDGTGKEPGQELLVYRVEVASGRSLPGTMLSIATPTLPRERARTYPLPKRIIDVSRPAQVSFEDAVKQTLYYSPYPRRRAAFCDVCLPWRDVPAPPPADPEWQQPALPRQIRCKVCGVLSGSYKNGKWVATRTVGKNSRSVNINPATLLCNRKECEFARDLPYDPKAAAETFYKKSEFNLLGKSLSAWVHKQPVDKDPNKAVHFQDCQFDNHVPRLGKKKNKARQDQDETNEHYLDEDVSDGNLRDERTRSAADFEAVFEKPEAAQTDATAIKPEVLTASLRILASHWRSLSNGSWRSPLLGPDKAFVERDWRRVGPTLPVMLSSAATEARAQSLEALNRLRAPYREFQGDRPTSTLLVPRGRIRTLPERDTTRRISWFLLVERKPSFIKIGRDIVPTKDTEKLIAQFERKHRDALREFDFSEEHADRTYRSTVASPEESSTSDLSAGWTLRYFWDTPETHSGKWDGLSRTAAIGYRDAWLLHEYECNGGKFTPKSIKRLREINACYLLQFAYLSIADGAEKLGISEDYMAEILENWRKDLIAMRAKKLYSLEGLLKQPAKFADVLDRGGMWVLLPTDPGAVAGGRGREFPGVVGYREFELHKLPPLEHIGILAAESPDIDPIPQAIFGTLLRDLLEEDWKRIEAEPRMKRSKRACEKKIQEAQDFRTRQFTEAELKDFGPPGVFRERLQAALDATQSPEPAAVTASADIS